MMFINDSASFYRYDNEFHWKLPCCCSKLNLAENLQHTIRSQNPKDNLEAKGVFPVISLYESQYFTGLNGYWHVFYIGVKTRTLLEEHKNYTILTHIFVVWFFHNTFFTQSLCSWPSPIFPTQHDGCDLCTDYLIKHPFSGQKDFNEKKNTGI